MAGRRPSLSERGSKRRACHERTRSSHPRTYSRFEYGYIPGINQGGQLLSGESDSEACLVGWEVGRHEVERKLAFVRPYSPRSFSFLTTSPCGRATTVPHPMSKRPATRTNVERSEDMVASPADEVRVGRDGVVNYTNPVSVTDKNLWQRTERAQVI